MPTQKAIAAALREEAGRTYAREAGFRVDDKPSALFQLLVLSTLLSARISSSIAVQAMRGIRDRGWTTADKLAESTWKQRVSVLNDAGYTRYQERTSTMLGDLAERVRDEYGGDLRELREQAERDPDGERRLLKKFKGLGDTGVDIFFREVQGVWDEVAPFFDKRALDGAGRLDLPKDAKRLQRLAGDDLPSFTAGLVRAKLDKDVAEAVREAAS